MSRISIAVIALCVTTASAPAYELTLGGLVQPAFEYTSADPALGRAEGGFVLERVRPYVIGEEWFGGVRFFLRIEADASPYFSLLDGYLGAEQKVGGDGSWRITIGQMRAPYGRQMMVWDAETQLPDKARLTTIEPGTQLGIMANLRVPHASWLEITGGLFNGEGRNVVNNIDTNFLYVGRVAVRPLGRDHALGESSLDGQTQLAIAADISWNDRANSGAMGNYELYTTLLGADLYAAWRGVSLYLEYLWGTGIYSDNLKSGKPDFLMHGLNAQAGWSLPFLGRMYHRFELVGRYEELVANDQTPLLMPGDDNQDQQRYTMGLNYFQDEHRLKAQLAFTHTHWAPDFARKTAGFSSDGVFLLLTFRPEVTVR